MKILSRRVRAYALAAVVLVGWIQLFEPDRARPTVLLPAVPGPVTELAVEAGEAQAVYSVEKERITLVGPPGAVADEAARGAAADRTKGAPSFTDLVPHPHHAEPSAWRTFRLSELAISCMNALAAGRVVLIPEPAAADRALTGIDHPEVVVRLTAGRPFEVRVGAAAPGSNSHYFHCPQTRVWGLISGDVASRLARLARRELPEE